MAKARGFLMASMIMLLPIALVITFSLAWNLVQDSGQALMEQRRSKVFYVGQAGLTAAFHIWSTNNFTGKTHEADGTHAISESDPDRLRVLGLDGYSLAGDGGIEWSWDSGQPQSQSFTRTASRERFRFKVFNPGGQLWTIRCESEVDGMIGVQEVGCLCESALDYVVFDNSDSNDFSMAEDHTVVGKIHANGNLFLRPWKTEGLYIPLPTGGRLPILAATNGTLELDSTGISAGGRIYRYRDHVGEADPGGNVTIQNSVGGLAPTLMEGCNQGQIGAGHAYDSFHPEWRDTALEKYQGVMTDSELGAQRRAVAARKALEPDGYYDLKAGLHIDSSTSGSWIQSKTFYNQAEERDVTVQELDIAAMAAANALPANGVIYSRVPIRLKNAGRLGDKLTIASSATIYTQGDFNSDPDGPGPLESPPASLITTDRVYNLTSSFDDNDSKNYHNPLAPLAGGPPPPKARDDGDPPNVLEINAAIVDGAPTQDVRAWLDDPANPYYIRNNFLNPLNGMKDTGVKQVPDGDPRVLKVAFPNSDDFLENLQDVHIKYRGSRVHLRTARMAKFDNSDCAGDPTLTPWVAKSGYIPPAGRTYTQDLRLSQESTAPPLAPRTARKLYWHKIR